MSPLKDKKGSKNIRITPEAHEMLIDLSVRRETFSDVIMKIGEHYKKTKK